MLAIETCVKVFNLTKNPAISHVLIGGGYVLFPNAVEIYSNKDVSLDEVISLVKDIFPECELERDDSPEVKQAFEGKRHWNRFRGEVRGEYSLVVNHYESIKESPAQDGATQENTLPDHTTEWSPEQIPRNEG